ncbi:hypothetical protein [Halosimplex sp. J119]
MSTRDGFGIALIIAAVALAAFVGVGAAQDGTATQDECRVVNGSQVCVTDLSVSKDPLVAGNSGEVTATIENVGNRTASPVVVLNVVHPGNDTGVFAIGEPAIEPGASTSVSQPLDANTTGTHGFQVQLVDRQTRGLYDTSDPVTVEVVDEVPARLGGPVDRVEIALLALVVALVGMGAVAYRQLR